MGCQTYFRMYLHGVAAVVVLGVRRTVNLRVGEEEASGFVSQTSCETPEEFGRCEGRVKDKLQTMECTDLEHIEGCIGAVLGDAENHDTECCKKGTEFDNFLLDGVPTRDYESLTIDSKTALAIIDVQKDFTVGSFGQSCWATGGGEMVDGIISLMNRVHAAGGTIIASKDMHTHKHCSFAGNGPCKNQKGYENLTFTPDQRYVNDFPSHCTYSVGRKYAAPDPAPKTPFCKGLKQQVSLPKEHFCNDEGFKGLAFDEKLAAAMGALPSRAKGKVEVVFKAFHDDYDSFSAIPHLVGNPSEEESVFTGGYALPEDRAKKCHGRWDTSFQCYPTINELADPVQKGMRSTLHLLKNITRLYTVGLVFDYCVKETAIFAKEAAAEGKWTASATSLVIGQLSRPSFDGKPGAPYVGQVCEGGKADGSFCTNGGGTIPWQQQVQADFEKSGVELFRYKAATCSGA